MFIDPGTFWNKVESIPQCDAIADNGGVFGNIGEGNLVCLRNILQGSEAGLNFRSFWNLPDRNGDIILRLDLYGCTHVFLLLWPQCWSFAGPAWFWPRFDKLSLCDRAVSYEQQDFSSADLPDKAQV